MAETEKSPRKKVKFSLSKKLPFHSYYRHGKGFGKVRPDGCVNEESKKVGNTTSTKIQVQIPKLHTQQTDSQEVTEERAFDELLRKCHVIDCQHGKVEASHVMIRGGGNCSDSQGGELGHGSSSPNFSQQSDHHGHPKMKVISDQQKADVYNAEQGSAQEDYDELMRFCNVAQEGDRKASKDAFFFDMPQGNGKDGDGVCMVYYMLDSNWKIGSVQIHLEDEIVSRDTVSIRNILQPLIGDGVPATIFYSIKYQDSPFCKPDPNRKTTLELGELRDYKRQYIVLKFYVWPENLYWESTYPKWITMQFELELVWVDLQQVLNVTNLKDIAKSVFQNLPSDWNLIWFSGKGAPLEFDFEIDEDDGTLWSPLMQSPLVAAVMKLLVRRI